MSDKSGGDLAAPGVSLSGAMGFGTREWVTTKSANDQRDALKVLAEETGLAPLALRVCLQRGLTDPGAIADFLNPRLDALTPPGRIKDMERAVVRLAKAKENGEAVRIYGDYDVDGTTGAALLTWVFRDLGVTATAAQPDRFKDGYGLNPGAVEQAHADGCRVLVTVDCGITSFAGALRARDLGIDLIIVDHHQLDPGQGLPNGAFAVLNPQRVDCESGLRQVCGCGLAFYLSVALRGHWRERGWFAQGGEPNLKRHLDLVVMATAADMVPLVGDNRVLVKHGLEVLKHTTKPGVAALMESSGLAKRDLSPSHLGFTLGPRINASGRLASASIALELLTTQDPVRAKELADQLEILNRERMAIQERIWDEIRGRVARDIDAGKFKNGIVVADPGWHEGVVGIVATRITETFRRPAVVIAIHAAEGKGKGSVRSFGGKNVLEALRASARFLTTFGGHAHAAGLSLLVADLENFTTAFDDVLGQMAADPAQLPLMVEGEAKLLDFTVQALSEIERLAPFGPGNAEPVFTIRAQVDSKRVLKDRHLKFILSDPNDHRAHPIEAIWFYGVEKVTASLSTEIDQLDALSEWACVPEVNRFRGVQKPALRVRDRRSI
ncbi:MAG: single-stranded-DNA-specific exonuclease RecJ [Bdellovibrionota bacterium]